MLGWDKLWDQTCMVEKQQYLSLMLVQVACLCLPKSFFVAVWMSSVIKLKLGLPSTVKRWLDFLSVCRCPKGFHFRIGFKERSHCPINFFSAKDYLPYHFRVLYSWFVLFIKSQMVVFCDVGCSGAVYHHCHRRCIPRNFIAGNPLK